MKKQKKYKITPGITTNFRPKGYIIWKIKIFIINLLLLLLILSIPIAAIMFIISKIF